MSERPSHLHATQAIIDGRYDEADARLAALRAADPDDARTYMLLGQLAEARRDLPAAMAMFGRAAELDPASGEYHALLGRSYARLNDRANALARIDLALSAGPLSDIALDALASIETQFGRHAQAAAILKRAVDQGTRNAAIHVNRASSLKFLGDFDGARAGLERAIHLAPHYHKAHAALTALGGITAEHNHLPRLLGLIDQTDDPGALAHLHHAAAKECEALGDFDRAWALFTRGKAILRDWLGPVQLSEPELLAALESAYRDGPAMAGDDAGCPSERPIFIVGMPRSGTTLLDRVLSNHSAVASIGESLAFAQQAKIAADSRLPQLLDPALVDALARGTDFTLAAQRYVEHGTMLADNAPHFVDKFHLNFMLAGHVLRAFSRARILCLVRDPIDTVVSNYRQLFEYSSPLYRYSLDLMATTEMVVAFRRAAAFWAAVAPERFAIVSYEALASDPEREARRVLDFCGLRWEAGCTAIERNRAPVATASSVQVREGINTRSIGTWRRYAGKLEGVRDRLREAGLIDAGDRAADT